MNKKIISMLIIAAMLAPSAGLAADTADAERPIETIVSNTYGAEFISNYMGTVKAIDGVRVTVAVETEDGETDAAFGVTEDTPVFNAKGETAELAVGDKVIAASASENLLTKDIKPVTAVLVRDETDAANLYCGRFASMDTETGLLSENMDFVIDVEEDKVKEYDGKLLAVIYELVTMSIPARTNPTAVVVIADDTDAAADDTDARQSVSLSFEIGDSKLSINGSDVEVEAPYVVGSGVTLVPVRVISEAFGAAVDWDEAAGTVTVKDGDTELVITIGSRDAEVNGESAELEEAAELTESGVTMVPLRFIAETLGAAVGYDAATQGITVER